MKNTTELRIMEVKNGKVIEDVSMGLGNEDHKDLDIMEKPVQEIAEPQEPHKTEIVIETDLNQDEMDEIEVEDVLEDTYEQDDEVVGTGISYNEKSFMVIREDLGAIHIVLVFTLANNQMSVMVKEYKLPEIDFESGIVNLHVKKIEQLSEFDGKLMMPEETFDVITEHYKDNHEK